MTNANGSVTYSETASPDSTDVVMTTTGAIGATTSLAPGTYQVSGDDSDLSGDTGTWMFALTVTPRAVPVGGYDLVGSDGGVFAFGGAPFLGSLPGMGVHVKDIVGMVPTSNHGGYWLAGADGGMFTFGNAPFLGSLPGIGVHVHDIVGIVPTANDLGYFLVGRDGGVFAFGKRRSSVRSPDGEPMSMTSWASPQLRMTRATGWLDQAVRSMPLEMPPSWGALPVRSPKIPLLQRVRATGSPDPTGGSSPSATPPSTARCQVSGSR